MLLGNRRTPPAVVATEGARIPMHCTSTTKSDDGPSGVTARSAAAATLERAAPPGGPSGNRPHSWTGYVTVTLGDPPSLQRLGPWSAPGEPFLGLQQPMRYQQLAHQVIEGLAGGPPVRIGSARGRSAWACSCSSGLIRRGSAILAPSTDSSAAAAPSWPMTSTTSTTPKAARRRRRPRAGHRRSRARNHDAAIIAGASGRHPGQRDQDSTRPGQHRPLKGAKTPEDASGLRGRDRDWAGGREPLGP